MAVAGGLCGRVAVVGLAVLAMACERPIAVSRDTPLLDDFSDCDPRNTSPKSVGVVRAGELVTIESRLYGKDFMCLHVKTAGGRRGYVAYRGSVSRDAGVTLLELR